MGETLDGWRERHAGHVVLRVVGEDDAAAVIGVACRDCGEVYIYDEWRGDPDARVTGQED